MTGTVGGAGMVLTALLQENPFESVYWNVGVLVPEIINDEGASALVQFNIDPIIRLSSCPILFMIVIAICMAATSFDF